MRHSPLVPRQAQGTAFLKLRVVCSLLRILQHSGKDKETTGARGGG
jgi:hypothetical protein